jgi:hypothetical protein
MRKEYQVGDEIIIRRRVDWDNSLYEKATVEKVTSKTIRANGKTYNKAWGRLWGQADAWTATLQIADIDWQEAEAHNRKVREELRYLAMIETIRNTDFRELPIDAVTKIYEIIKETDNDIC